MKKLFSLVLALTLALSLGSAALAFEWDAIYTDLGAWIMYPGGDAEVYAPGSKGAVIAAEEVFKKVSRVSYSFEQGGAMVEGFGWKKIDFFWRPGR